MVTDFCVEDDGELSHACGEGEFGGFSVGAEAFVEVSDGWIAAGCGNGGHVENVAQIGPSAGNGTTAVSVAAVIGEGGDADEAGSLSAADGAEFAHIGDQGSGEDGADAGDGGEQAVEGLFAAVAADEGKDGGIEFVALALEGEDALVGAGGQGREVEMVELVLEGDQLALKGAAVGDVLADFVGGGIAAASCRRGEGAAIVGEDCAIERRLGSLPLERSKSRTWRGLTMAATRPASVKAMNTARS